MTTTNPGGDAPRPVTGPAPGEGMSWPHGGMDAPDEHGGGGGVRPESIAAGHEPDQFQYRPIFAIPAAVIVTFIVAYLVTAGVFRYFMSRPGDPQAHPAASARNAQPLNERLDRIDRGKGTESDQPRLEILQKLTEGGSAWTQEPLAGNPPLLHADMVRASKDRHPELYRSGAAGPDGVNRVSIDAVISAADTKDARQALFPVRANAGPVSTGHALYPAAGRGRPPVAPVPEAKKGGVKQPAEKAGGDKTPDGKNADGKKPEEKKADSKTEPKK